MGHEIGAHPESRTRNSTFAKLYYIHFTKRACFFVRLIWVQLISQTRYRFFLTKKCGAFGETRTLMWAYASQIRNLMPVQLDYKCILNLVHQTGVEPVTF